MIEFRETPDSSVVELTLDGHVTGAEFDDVVQRLEAAISRHGKIQVLEEIVSFGTIPPSKWWEDLRFAFKHMRDIDRIAIVTDRQWIELVIKAFKPLVHGELRLFHTGDLEAARNWLHQAEHAAPGSVG